MKRPLECENMDEIRFEIDAIDSDIVALIGKRAAYVHAAAKFKKNTASVQAPDRVQRMLAHRRQWAEAQQIDPDFIETLFATMVDYFIRSEMKTWRKGGGEPQN